MDTEASVDVDVTFVVVVVVDVMIGGGRKSRPFKVELALMVEKEAMLAS